ncbi:MAG: hypothetical protein KAT68_01815 [Bacteroidales bacterium]|nr:hypothetical protein [Bacteroidales bacterium]
MEILYNKISKSVIVLTITILIANLSFSQGIYYGNDTTIYTDDTIKVIANEHRGNIQWQKSYDFTAWSDIIDENNDTLFFVGDTTTYFRAKITEGTCNPVYSDTASVSVIALSSETVIIEDSTSTVVSDSTQLENGIYVIEFDDEIPDIKINSVIVGTEGYGYLRKVTGISKNKSTLTLETEDAKLTDVIEECNIIDSIKLLLDSANNIYYNGKIIPMKVVYLADGVKLKTKGSGIDLTNRILYSGNVGDYTLTAKITQGSINFEPIFNRELEIQKIPLSVKNLSLSAGGNLDLDMILEVEGNYQGVFSEEIIIAQFAFGPIMIGPAPMYIGLSFAAGFETELKTNGIISSGFDATTSIEFGASYNKYANPKWTRIWECDGSYTQYPTDWGLSANVHARAYVSPRLSITIGYDPFKNSNAGKNISRNDITIKDTAKFISAGPYFELEPYLRFDGEINIPNWQYELAGGFDGNLGFEVSAFGYTITNWENTLTNWETIIFEDNGQFENVPPTASFIVTPTSGTTATVFSFDASGSSDYEDDISELLFSWDWENDGTWDVVNSSNTSETHQYGTEKTYLVKLKVEDTGGEIGETIQTINVSPFSCGNPFTDSRDGQTYNTVQIGNQCWMAENLNIGTRIDGINDQTNNAIIEKYCYNDLTSNCDIYGALYQWNEIMQYNSSDNGTIGTTQGICPTGWHIPTHYEWTTLERAVCTSSTCDTDFPYDYTTQGWRGTDEGNKLKEEGTSHWEYYSDNTLGTNESGFTALPGGANDVDNFGGLGNGAQFWSSTEYNASYGWSRIVEHDQSKVHRGWQHSGGKKGGWSVRCVKN